MTASPRLQRAAATLALTTGAGLLALSANGIASLDTTLRAAVPARDVTTRMVVDVDRDRGDCGARAVRFRPEEL
ncbi:MAG TPA: hypothetical protein VM266_15275 [Solirubrobacteraceae bacterium]|nr:hypothetical protein [Solirubrobacteraceae bacterium]